MNKLALLTLFSSFFTSCGKSHNPNGRSLGLEPQPHSLPYEGHNTYRVYVVPSAAHPSTFCVVKTNGSGVVTETWTPQGPLTREQILRANRYMTHSSHFLQGFTKVWVGSKNLNAKTVFGYFGIKNPTVTNTVLPVLVRIVPAAVVAIKEGREKGQSPKSQALMALSSLVPFVSPGEVGLRRVRFQSLQQLEVTQQVPHQQLLTLQRELVYVTSAHARGCDSTVGTTLPSGGLEAIN